MHSIVQVTSALLIAGGTGGRGLFLSNDCARYENGSDGLSLSGVRELDPFEPRLEALRE